MKILPKSYDTLDWYFEESFQPLMRPHGRFDSFKWKWWQGRAGSVGVKFGSDVLFIMPISENTDIDVWVHEFVEVTVSGIVTNILELEPFIDISIYLFNKRIGWWKVCFCHLLAALTTGQRYKDEKNNYYIVEPDEVASWVESSLQYIKNGLKYESEE